jgi:hypothetical protein
LGFALPIFGNAGLLEPTAVGFEGGFYMGGYILYLVVVVNSDELYRYCNSFLDKLAAAAMDAAEEGYIEITKKFVSSPMPHTYMIIKSSSASETIASVFPALMTEKPRLRSRWETILTSTS